MLELKAIGIRRFKGIVDTVIELDENLTLLIGPNGTGKSTILQAFSFIRAFAAGEVNKLFEDRHWIPDDLKPKGVKSKSAPVAFDLLLSSPEGRSYVWQIRWNVNTERTQQERLWYKASGRDIIEVFSFDSRRGLSVDDEHSSDVLKTMRSSSSVMSSFVFADEDDGYDSDEVHDWALSILSLELLSTSELRRNSRTSSEPFGLRGERFSSYLNNLSDEARENIVKRVARFYPIGGIHLKKKRAGWVEMSITDALGNFQVNSNHVSDGVLRMIAFAALPEAKGQFSIVLIDEVEDGIEPHHLKDFVKDFRSQIQCQVLATSHSPVIANFANACEVKMVWRNADANIFAIPVADLDVFKDEYLGIGEAWINTSNKAIGRNIEKVREASNYPIGDRVREWRGEVEDFFASQGIV